MTELFLGLDGGQSGTTAVIGDEKGRLLGRGEAGPCDYAGAAGGPPKILRAIRESISAACRGLSLDPDRPRFAAACLGFSGGPAGKQAIVEQALDAEKLIITTDASIALTGATGSGQGIIVIAGTGSIAYGRDASGRTARAGGWGHVFGDEGGAFDLVRQALRAALRSEEGWGPSTTLGRKLMDAAAAGSVNELLHLFYTTDFPRERVASYAPLVDQAAVEGDSAAGEILEKAARQLADIAFAVRRQLFPGDEPARVTYAGGVFRGAVMRERFRALVELERGCRCEAPLHEPAVGALLEAYRAAALNPEIATGMLRSHF